MTQEIYNIENGLSGLLYYLAENTGGWFFVIMLIVFGIILFSIMIKFNEFDSVFLATTFAMFIVSIPIWFAGALTDRAFFVFITLLVIAIIKSTIFKDN